MKKVFFLFAIVFTAAVASAQVQSPVSWSFASKKAGDNAYELQMTATIQNGWHLYPQAQPSDAIAVPTSLQFSNNPLIQLEGKVKEAGKVEHFTDKELGVSANQYSKVVVFTQKVKLKGKAKSNVSGNVTCQTCDDKKCLPPKTVTFNIALK